MKKKSVAELGHSDLIPVYKSSFASMPIFQEIVNRFLGRYNQSNLQIESYQSYAIGQSKMAVGCCY